MERQMERVELHLHTGVSDETSVISAREAVKMAEAMGHKALAITNLNTVQDCLADRAWWGGTALKVIYGVQLLCDGRDTVNVLAKDREGMKALYRLVTEAEYNRKTVSRAFLEERRAHLLIGAVNHGNSLFEAACNDAPEEQLRKLAAFYDYIELEPKEKQQAQEANQRLYALGKKMGIPVVAVGNCHYLAPEDRICKKIVDCVRNKKTDAGSTWLRTTREMLELFAYLGEEAAYEVVVTNTNLIADRIDFVKQVGGPYLCFTLPNAYEEVRQLCEAKLRELYPQPLPEIRERLEEELAGIQNEYRASMCLLVYRIVSRLQGKGLYTGTRGSVGSTLVTYLLGISDTNPLPAHYWCSCGYMEFVPDAASGYDLPPKTCPVCGKPVQGDGHNLPYETFLGVDGDLMLDIDVNVPSSHQEECMAYLVEWFGKDRVARAGTVGTISDRIAERYIRFYEDTTGMGFSPQMREWIIGKLRHVKNSQGCHPGGVILLPEGMKFEEVTPLRRAETPMGGIDAVTHMEYYLLDWFGLSTVVPKLDLLGHGEYDRLNRLFQMTGTKPSDIDYSDKKVYRLFERQDTAGVPEFENLFTKGLLQQVGTVNFSDLVRISGMIHGTNVWRENGEQLLGEHAFQELIGDRDDIFLTLRRYGVDRKTAFKAMTATRKGKFCRYPELIQQLQAAGVPDWYLESMQKVHYLFPKAHAATYVKLGFCMAWFKVYYPEEFYRSYVQTHRNSFPPEFLTMTWEEREERIEELSETGRDYITDRRYYDLVLLQEAAHFGIDLKALSER